MYQNNEYKKSVKKLLGGNFLLNDANFINENFGNYIDTSSNSNRFDINNDVYRFYDNLESKKFKSNTIFLIYMLIMIMVVIMLIVIIVIVIVVMIVLVVMIVVIVIVIIVIVIIVIVIIVISE